VTIPRRLRDKAGLLPGCEVEFVEDRGRVYLRKARGSSRGQSLIARMRGRGSVRMSTDEILALTRCDR
jgi:bifunctional DNA-binding transcriptional regulator/antitoxin component of YhaV-PrlF toxin-antitoxin module